MASDEVVEALFWTSLVYYGVGGILCYSTSRVTDKGDKTLPGESEEEA